MPTSINDHRNYWGIDGAMYASCNLGDIGVSDIIAD